MRRSLSLRVAGLLMMVGGAVTLGSCGAPSDTASVVQAARPDLVISARLTGSATLTAAGREVPFSVTVRNIGTATAGRFKVSADYRGSSGSFAVAFSVPGQGMWYPYVASLAPGGSRRIDGKLVFNRRVTGPVSVRALADSCSGDEFMPSYCRVLESNEGNNLSGGVAFSL